MTKHSDLKKLVRARMQKTGESYMAARAQISNGSPAEEEYPDLAGMSDASVAAKTQLTWLEWVGQLDALGAAQMSHAAIAKAVAKGWPLIGGWWVQSVTVGYERIRGLRQKGQLCSGDFAASKSKTFPVSVGQLFAAFAESEREAWMGAAAVLRTEKLDRSMRLTWPDGTVVSAWFTAKGEAKASVAIQHEKLESQERREAEKTLWGERLTALGEHLDAPVR